jgi:hypothetical protein
MPRKNCNDVNCPIVWPEAYRFNEWGKWAVAEGDVS